MYFLGAGWDSRETPHSPTTNYHEVTLGLRQQQKPPPAQTLEGLPGGPDCEEVDDEAEGEENVRSPHGDGSIVKLFFSFGVEQSALFLSSE